MVLEVPVYGNDDAVAALRPTYNLGGVVEPSRDELAAMQKGSYVLHAREGRLSRVPAEKTLLPHDPKGHPQRVHAAMAPDGTVYFSQGSVVSKSTDGGRTWSSHELTLGAAPNCSFQVLRDGTFVAVGDPRRGVELRTQKDPSRIVVWSSGDEGRSWEKFSEIDNPTGASMRLADTLCRLPDDTLLVAVESRGGLDPNYVHSSSDGGKTWIGPARPYSSEPVFVGTHWEYAQTTGSGFLADFSYETMIARMASGRLLAVIRYHGPVNPQWPLIDPGRSVGYKNLFLADSEDQGVTWKDLRPLTNVGGQCHGFAAGLSDGSVVVTHDHRYPPGTPCGRAMVSRDEGMTWEDEAYFLYFGTSPRAGSGFSESVVLEDDTILTVAATSEAKESQGWDEYIGQADVWAIRWRLDNE